jgi:hypothetical protein
MQAPVPVVCCRKSNLWMHARNPSLTTEDPRLHDPYPCPVDPPCQHTCTRDLIKPPCFLLPFTRPLPITPLAFGVPGCAIPTTSGPAGAATAAAEPPPTAAASALFIIILSSSDSLPMALGVPPAVGLAPGPVVAPLKSGWIDLGTSAIAAVAPGAAKGAATGAATGNARGATTGAPTWRSLPLPLKAARGRLPGESAPVPKLLPLPPDRSSA